MSITTRVLRGGIAVHGAIFKATRGRVLGKAAGGPILMLRTTGRRSGESRETPLMYCADGDSCVLIASNGGAPRHPAWYLNLEANPDVEVQIGSNVRRMRARRAVGQERERLWRASNEQYGGYDGYREKTDREIPVVVLEPSG